MNAWLKRCIFNLYFNLNLRLPWIRRLRSPPDQAGRNRRGPSLATAGPPCKQPLMGLLSPRSVLGAERSVLLESKYPLLPTISILPLCSQALERFQPLTTRAEAWQAIPGVSEGVMATIRQGYTLQFDRRPPCFRVVGAITVRSKDAQVLCTEVMNLLVKGAIEVVSPAQSELGFYSCYFLAPKTDGGLRPILDLRLLNHSLIKTSG